MRNIVWIALILCGLSVAVIAQTRAGEQTDALTLSRLRSVGQAMHMYAAENKGFLPAELSLLKRVLGPEAAEAAQRDFVWAVAPATRINRIKQLSQFPVALSRPAGGDGSICVLFADGHVQTYLPASANRVATPTTQAGAAGARPPMVDPAEDGRAAPNTVPADVPSALVGAWQTKAGFHVATYQFNADGNFTLTFSPSPNIRWEGPGSGKAGGTWKLDGKTLTMTNTSSNTPFTRPGEQEQAEIVGVDDKALVLETTDRKGQTERVTLRRTVPFEKGKRDNEKIVGTWNRLGMTIVIADSGMVVFGPSKGEWSQRRNRLVLVLDGMPAEAPGRPPERRAARGYRQPMNVSFTIDLLDDTTLVLTGSMSPDQRPETLTLLRVK